MAYLLHHEQRMRDRVLGTEKASADERLAVYGSAYRLRLLEALRTDFAKVHGLLGDAEFDRLGHAYIDMYPSEHPSLRWFGRHLSRFLTQTTPYCKHLVLAEMAAFEWAQGEVFDAEDELVLNIADVAAIAPDAWPDMRLILHPSSRRLTLQWNVPSIWQAIDKNQTPPAPERADTASTWLLWRSGLEIHWRSLAVDEAWAVDACIAGRTFGEICEGLCEWIDEAHASLHAAGMLKRWVTDGLVARMETR